MLMRTAAIVPPFLFRAQVDLGRGARFTYPCSPGKYECADFGLHFRRCRVDSIILAGDFMSKRPPAVSTALSSLNCFVLATTCALMAFGGSAAQAAASPTPQPPQIFLDYCRQARNPAATQLCLDAANQDANGNPAAALALLEKSVGVSPKVGSLRMLLGYHLLGLGASAPAERELRLARAQGVPDAVVLAPLFRAMLAQHEEEKLLKEFPEPAAKVSGDVAAQVLRGRALALRFLGRIDEAAAQMDRSLSLERAPLALCDRADIALQQKNPALANKLIDEALKLDPNNGPALVAKLDQLERSGDTAMTLAISDQILKIYPNNVNSRLARIRVFLKLQQDSQAKTEVDAILARSPNQSLGRYYRAVLMSRAKDNRDAFELIKTLPTYFPRTYPGLALQMAQIAFDNGNVETGATILGSALAASPDLIDVRLRLVAYQMSQKSPQAAMVILTPVQDSTDPRVKKFLAQAREMIVKQRPTW
jgi:cellulose synthase operon protein C